MMLNLLWGRRRRVASFKLRRRREFTEYRGNSNCVRRRFSRLQPLVRVCPQGDHWPKGDSRFAFNALNWDPVADQSRELLLP